jgi:twitching motility protein PilT
MAAMIEYINNIKKSRIITIEDPIEYLFKHKKSNIDQREVGPDTNSFKNALRHVFRQDPNIIFIGETRDLESLHIALTLAETGHLVLTTLHTTDATHSISRIVDIFPPHQQNQIRLQLSMVLVGVVSQKLIKRAHDKPGRALATEVMNVTSSIRNLIRENDLPQVYSTIQTGKKYGMHTMNQSLVGLYRRGEISYEDALQCSNNQEELLSLISAI